MGEILSYSADKAYKRSSVETATPMGLIVMLYDGAIANLVRAERAMEQSNGTETSLLLGRTQDIIYELMGSLNFEKGGDIARNLFRLYEYMTYRLLQANLRSETGILREVRGLMEQLREAWLEVEKKVGASRKERTGGAVL